METVVATIAALFHQVHADLRMEVEGLDDAAIHWVPGPDTNSIAVLVVHALGSEADVVRMAHGAKTDRDRAAEFIPNRLTAADLLARLAGADAVLDELAPQITAEDLATLRERPSHPAPQPSIYWLIQNYGHAREHLAHVQLTKQLYHQQA